jgi:hypothetical protein
MSVEQRSGRVTFLRVHDVGSKYGPSTDQIDVEVVIQLNHSSDPSLGFQLRNDTNRVAHQGMLDLLRDAFNHGWQTTVDYEIESGKKNGVLFRVWLTK